MSVIRNAAATMKQMSLNVAKVTWIMLLYILSIWLVLGSLSSYQFQVRMNMHRLSDGRAITVSEIINELNEYERTEYLESALDDDLLQLKDQRDKKVELSAVRRDAEIHAREILELLTGRIEAALSKAAIAEGLAWERLTLQEIYERLQNKAPEVIDLWQQYNLTIAQYNKARDLTRLVESELEGLERDMSKRSIEMVSYKQKKNNIVKDTEGYMNEVVYMRQMKFHHLAIMPVELLTLILTLSMGTLGSVIYLTRSFFDQEQEEPMSWMFLRPFLGMITALAIYIISKAGLVVASASMGGGETANELNPFFISFLAIVSGLMSEQAFRKLHNAGMEFFKVEDKDARRWGVGLAENIQKRGKALESFAESAGVTVNKAREWVEERAPAPPHIQQYFAVWLDASPRRLFTDQPPDTREDKEKQTPPAAPVAPAPVSSAAEPDPSPTEPYPSPAAANTDPSQSAAQAANPHPEGNASLTSKGNGGASG